MSMTQILLLGLGFWWLTSKGRAAAPATPAPTPGYSPTGEVVPIPGESPESYTSRALAWQQTTGQPAMFYEGYGRTGPMWRSMGMVPKR